MQQIHTTLNRQKDGWPKLVVFDSCKLLIKALATPLEDKNPEDIDPEFELDHVIDCLAYGLQWRERTFKKQQLVGT